MSTFRLLSSAGFPFAPPNSEVLGLAGVGLTTGILVSLVVGEMARRSKSGSHLPLAWLAFVVSSELTIGIPLGTANRCAMSLEEVALRLLAGVVVGALIATVTFRVSHRRGWAGQRLSLASALLATLSVLVFVGYVGSFYLSDLCFGRDFEI
jgi:hypothetical protein